MRIQHIGMTFVKCSQFLDLGSVQIRRTGMAGDREFLILDESGGLMPSHRHNLFMPLIFGFNPETEMLELTYPDGLTVCGTAAAIGPPFPLDYLGMRLVEVRAVEGDWDARLTDFAGRPARLVRAVAAGSGIDVLPITLVTTGTLGLLAGHLGKVIDHRRLRANLVIENDTPFIEDSWDGRLLRIGSAVLRVRCSVPRCIVTHLEPETGHNDLNIVPTLGKFRPKSRLPDGLMPNYASPGCASYAEVIEPGTVSVTDTVALL